MKMSILIFGTVLTTFGLASLGYLNWSDAATHQEKAAVGAPPFSEHEYLDLLYGKYSVDLFYNVDSRFATTITREELHQARSIMDILPANAIQSVASYQMVEVVILQDDEKIRAKGEEAILNAAQLKLLQAADYSSDFYISASCQSRNLFSDKLEKDTIIYYLTVIPEREAEYPGGLDALVEYLRSNSKEQTAIMRESQLKPGKVTFTVTRQGTIADVRVTSTSGYPSVDETMTELITRMPGAWKPATNGKGKKVEQEFVFFFGLEGC